MTGVREGPPDSSVTAEPGRPRGNGTPAGDSLLTVTGLTKHFPVMRGIIFRHAVGQVRAVDDVSFSVAPGETLGVVGESGCGKTTTARMIVRLVEPTAGQIVFDGHDITHIRQGAMRPLRREIQMIFQDPYSSLNPRHTVGTIVGAPWPAAEGQDREGDQAERPGTAGTRRAQPRALQPLPVRVLRRPAAADRHRAHARAAAQAHRRRRAGVRAGCVHPGPGDQPARATCRASSG